MPVAFEELVGSPVVEINDGQFTATRKFKIAWSDSVDFASELIGTWAVSGSTLTYTAPAAFPGFTRAICRRARFDPFPEDRIATGASSDLATSTNQPPYAMVTAVYEIVQNASGLDTPDGAPTTETGTFLSVRESFGAEYLSTPGRGWFWNDGDVVDPDLGPLKLIPTGQIHALWSRVPQRLIPYTAITNCRGKVNNASFLNRATETVLFLGADINHEHQLDGVTLVSIEYTFSVREIKDGSNVRGWNHEYKPDAAAGFDNWQYQYDNGGRKHYQEANFGSLLRFT